MTLAEVMVALFLLAMLAMSVMKLTFYIRKQADQAVYQNTALTLAQGYMEQVRHLDYTTLKDAAQISTKALPLDKTDGTAVIKEGGGTYVNNAWAQETVYLDQTDQGVPIQPLKFRFRTSLTSLETATAGLASGVEVRIDYQILAAGGIRAQSGALRSVRSSVPTY